MICNCKKSLSKMTMDNQSKQSVFASSHATYLSRVSSRKNFEKKFVLCLVRVTQTMDMAGILSVY
jgi:hypothetical protein